ncbi:anaerobic sulfatase maturase [Clostridium botulinum]|uniref:anaerobic sulfatase maturase n=1 Tax=Clostridium botulinum TaxID=1491 RepID=UPI00069C1641|nr:anaerobic sulfatase maturase [Clostridium botulinum]KOA92212.1 radical SAM protein [Clostridium botulinum]MCD3202971.1 anaerobic sulfatase maturase [Clostridium botulinum C/D]MCD3223065.1 anaerobic sulfatase maturase [Clostridium botulinum C/D]MCD3230947.1 anaerobic sulfatase maturase [Clostridium botulinum C/D]MCD3273839.1 anaerobic sulfatase maturase [Clostridium botulinum C/D]
MKSLSMLIKPSSSNCNLRCTYCFYYDICTHRNVKSFGMMKVSLLETLVKKAFDEAEVSCTFAFQGGEPTLVGIEFFKSLITFVKKYNKNNINVFYAIQTNGTTINEDWANFFKEHNFLVGVSLDGTKEIHDQYRLDDYGKGSFNKIMTNINLLNKYNVQYNILSVVHKNTSRHISKIYKFFKKQDFRYLQFIPCLDPINDSRENYPYSLNAKDYEIFLNKLFDLWFDDFIKGRFISIRYFDDLLSILLGNNPGSCCMNGFCSCEFIIEADGSVYPCDFYVFDKYKLGLIEENSFTELFNSKITEDFIKSSCNHSSECDNCKWYPLCRSGCRRNKEPNFPNNINDNIFCSSFKGFFEKNIDRLTYAAKLIMKNNSKL